MDDHNSYGRQVNDALAGIGPARQAALDGADQHAQAAARQDDPGRPPQPQPAAGLPPGPELPNTDK